MRDDPRAFRAGTLLTVRFDEPTRAPAIRIPLEALVHRDGKTCVFVVPSGDTKVKLRALDVDRADGKDVLVRGGLQDGERIIREGADFLQDGQAVRLLEP